MRKSNIRALLANLILPAILFINVTEAKEYHVSPTGSDQNVGDSGNPLKTISAAAKLAQPGDVITIHEGTYREAISPTRGGSSEQQRITYQAAQGEKVFIKGSERITNWQHVSGNSWQAKVSNALFGDFNPYSDVIKGDWFRDNGRDHHTGSVYLNNHWLAEAESLEQVQETATDDPLWFAEVGLETTTIWAHFTGVNPNEELVEINVRQSVFYPKQPGINYITVQGFNLMHAATPWAPPTAEQIGLIGSHWSKGWIIENNTISYSRSTCVTLGKYGDKWDNTSADTADGYVKTIERAGKNGWSEVGHHIIRNNRISHCGQAGIVGSLGATFSEVSHNEIHDIHVRDDFSGAEIAAIKLHAPVNALISHNHIYNSFRGIWLDWMTQGAHVTRNLLHDNLGAQDIFIEANHGPYVVDHNIALSYVEESFYSWLSSFAIRKYVPGRMKRGVLDRSQGGTYAHNLILGGVMFRDELDRETPYMAANSTEIIGFENMPGGDIHFYNNILVNRGIECYGDEPIPTSINGNVYLDGAESSSLDKTAHFAPNIVPDISVIEKDDGWYLNINANNDWAGAIKRSLVTTKMLGKTRVTGEKYTLPTGEDICLDSDYLGSSRNENNPFPGPFSAKSIKANMIKVWSK